MTLNLSSPDRGDWLQTFTGRAFFPLDPRPEEVEIADIAHALAYQCRYGGHVRRFYSVAEHSLLVSRHVTPRNALWGLLHDASEAYLIDVPRPVKRMLALYRNLEVKAMAAIARRFDLAGEPPEEIKRIETELLFDERAALMATSPAPWNIDEKGATGLGARIEALAPERAEMAFLERYFELTRAG